MFVTRPYKVILSVDFLNLTGLSNTISALLVLGWNPLWRAPWVGVSSCGAKRPVHLLPAVLTLLPFPVECHDRSLWEEGFLFIYLFIHFHCELDHRCRHLSAVDRAFIQVSVSLYLMRHRLNLKHSPTLSPVNWNDSTEGLMLYNNSGH